MIDYIQQLNAFNERCLVTGLAPRARVVYYTLMDMNNRLFWVSSFRTTIRIIADRSGVDKSSVADCLRILKNEGYIDYIPSSKKGTGSTIKICPLLRTEKRTEKNVSVDLSVDSSVDSSAIADNNKTQEKRKQEKRKHISMRAQFVPPTLEEVNEYVMEKNLHVSAKDFYDYFDATNWIDSKGQPVKSWKGKLLTWEKFQPKTKPTQNRSPLDDIDRAIEFFDREGSA